MIHILNQQRKYQNYFKNDGFDLDLKVKSNKECIKVAPWNDVKNEAELYIGKNIFWIENFDDKTEFITKMDDKEIKNEYKIRRRINPIKLF